MPMMETQQKDKGVSVSWEYHREEAKQELKVTTHWETESDAQLFSDLGQLHQNAATKFSVDGGGGFSSSGGCPVLAGKRAAEKRRAKMEKTISLQLLRRYFSGTLKDAAKSIGVCPTTLKRICRQHGISRWPSRKIKKVDHSLRKLQLVIDSVQGGESFYSCFPEPSSPNFYGSRHSNHPSPSATKVVENGKLKQVEFGPKSETCSDSQSSGSSVDYGFRVKAVLGQVKIIFRLQPSWGFKEVQQEIAKRFNVEDMSRIDLKYLDDDYDWVLLTCDADLQECIHVYKSSQAHTIQITIHQPSNYPNLASTAPL